MQDECTHSTCVTVEVDDPGKDPELMSLTVSVALGYQTSSVLAAILRNDPADSTRLWKLAAHLAAANADTSIDDTPSVSEPVVGELLDAVVDCLVRLPVAAFCWRADSFAGSQPVVAMQLLRVFLHAGQMKPHRFIARLSDVFDALVSASAQWSAGVASLAAVCARLSTLGEATMAVARRPLCALVPSAIKVVAIVYADEHMRRYHTNSLAYMMIRTKPAIGLSVDGQEVDFVVVRRLRADLADLGLADEFARTLVHSLVAFRTCSARDSPHDVALCLLPVVGDKTIITTGHIRKPLIDAGLLPVVAKLIGERGLHRSDGGNDDQLYSRALYTVSGWLTEMRFEPDNFRTLVAHGMLERLALALCTPPEQHEVEAYCLISYRLGHLGSALRGNLALAEILRPRFKPLYLPVSFFARSNIYPAIQKTHGFDGPLAKLHRDAFLAWTDIALNLGIDDKNDMLTAARVRPCARYECKQSEATCSSFAACSGCRIFFYCSTDCAKAEWKASHKVSCPLLRTPKHLL